MSFEFNGNSWSHHPEYDKGFTAGQQSKQTEIDELQKRIDDLLVSIDWHIEDCDFWLLMNKNDSWKGGQLEILKAIRNKLKVKTMSIEKESLVSDLPFAIGEQLDLIADEYDIVRNIESDASLRNRILSKQQEILK